MRRPEFSTIETPRLIIRRFSEEDLPTLLAYRNDAQVAIYQGWESMSEAEGREFIAAMSQAEPGAPGPGFQVAIALRPIGPHIGD